MKKAPYENRLTFYFTFPDNIYPFRLAETQGINFNNKNVNGDIKYFKTILK